jgi:hypothetical protein
MRIATLVFTSTLGLVACGTVPDSQTTEASTGTDTDTSTSTSPSTTNSSPTSPTPACVPGQSVACACTNGLMGAQVCNPSGTGFGACECEGGGSNSDSDSPTSDPSPTTGPETTTDPGVETDTGTTTEDDTTTTGGVMCEDPGTEPNDDEASAENLGQIACNDQPKSFSGVLAGAADVDWFQYHAVSNFCGFGGPDPSHQVTADGDVRLCVFVDCDVGNPNVGCEGGATAEDSPEGHPGCCNNGEVNFSLNCMGGPENAQFYLRLDQAADACVSYEVTYEY